MLVLGVITTARASEYEQRRAASVQTCTAIDPAASQSGLFFNPDGYRSFYLRSQCFQQAAVNFRDDTLCTQVKQRRSLLSSSWGYSVSQCRKLVADGIASDRRTLEDVKLRYVKGPITLRAFRIEPNGNGRDFDIVPEFAGENAGGYTLTFEIVPATAGAPIVLHSTGYMLDGRSNIRVYVRSEDIRQRVPDFAPGRRYSVRATLTLSVPTRTGDVLWPDSFIERVFPERERSQSMTKEMEFPAARRASVTPRRPSTVGASTLYYFPAVAFGLGGTVVSWA
jgi:hypothetical protein